MKKNPNRHSSRLQNYNYSAPGWYFITICTQNRICLFGEIANQKMVLNDAGQIINEWWSKIPERFANVALDQSQIMPNHIHGIIRIVVRAKPPHPTNNGSENPTNGSENPTPTTITTGATLGQIIAWFKYQSTKYVNVWAGIIPSRRAGIIPSPKIFQRNYYERIIRNKNELNRIRQYIKLNPRMWEKDKNNPVQNPQS